MCYFKLPSSDEKYEMLEEMFRFEHAGEELIVTAFVSEFLDDEGNLDLENANTTYFENVVLIKKPDGYVRDTYSEGAFAGWQPVEVEELFDPEEEAE